MLTDRELQAVLAWSALPWVGERTLWSLLVHAREGRRSLAELWETPLRDLTALVPLHARTVAALESSPAARWAAAGEDARTLRSWGVDLLLAGEADFPAVLHPSRIAPRRWPVLFAYGALGLVDEPRVALFNSRNVSNAGLTVTDALADALARRDVATIASPNRESYQTAAVAAKRQAGPSILALDRGLAAMFPDGLEREPIAAARVWDEAFDPDLQLLLSPFAWKEPWNPRSGPRRDALVCDLSTVAVAIDVQAGGVIEQELLTSLRHGRQVVVLDRGQETASGAQSLAREPGATVIRWRGADDAAERLLPFLGSAPQDAGARLQAAWLREVYRLLPRLIARLSSLGGRLEVEPPTTACFPAAGGLARCISSEGHHDPTRSQANILLADLTGETTPGRVAQLLTRVVPGGFLAALVPAAWLTGMDQERDRERWMGDARCRAVVRLPLFQEGSSVGDGQPLAVLVLQPGPTLAREEPTPAFSPRRRAMGRFHLRRYFEEVLASLSA